jgi:hypothetical protein
MARGGKHKALHPRRGQARVVGGNDCAREVRKARAEVAAAVGALE